MASIKFIAAVALTLVIITPIGMGFLLSMSDETTTTLERGEGVNVTDLLINSEANYVTTYTGVSNNSYLTGGGYPTYVKTGSTVTAYPVISSTTTSYSFSSGGIILVDVNGDVLGYPTEAAEKQTGTGTTAYVGLKMQIKSADYSGSDLQEVYAWEWYGTDLLKVYTGTSDDLTEHTFTQVTLAYVYRDVTTPTVNITKYSYSDSTYGDVSYGWTMPSGSSWTNTHANETVSFLVDVSGLSRDGSTGYLGFVLTDADGGWIHDLCIYKDGNSGMISVYELYASGHGVIELGVFDELRVTIDSTTNTFTVDGITSWPTFGYTPTVINSVSVTTDEAVDEFSDVLIYYQKYTSKPVFRVDSTIIKGGTYPAIVDKIYDPTSSFPGYDVDFVIKGADVYGDAITVGDTSYAVTDGRIALDDGTVVRLKDASFRFQESDGVHTVSVNGTEICASEDAVSIGFSGLWSMTAYSYKLEEKSSTSLTWHAGEFGLDRTGIAAVGLLVCGGLLVGLGMTGARSGAKIGALLLICGGAALVYIMII